MTVIKENNLIFTEYTPLTQINKDINRTLTYYFTFDTPLPRSSKKGNLRYEPNCYFRCVIYCNIADNTDVDIVQYVMLNT